MTIRKTDGDKTVWAMEGRLDATASAQLQKELETIWDDLGKDIVFDFTALSYISSAGLRVLLMTEKRARACGVQFTVTGASQTVREIFDITGFTGALAIV